MSKNSIALIGFMATGKTTIGKALIKYLNSDYQYIETDQLITEIAGKSILRIFSEDGEAKFREYETSVCKNISKLKDLIISCGGGVVLNWANIENLSKICHIILLVATPDEIYKRILKNGKEIRPILNNKDIKTEIVRLLEIRKPYYEKAADIIIDTTNKKIENIVQEIIIKTNLKN